MSDNVNPFLFSASASVFDNISGSSAVLLPPQNLPPGIDEGSAGDVGSSASSLPMTSVTPNCQSLTSRAAENNSEVEGQPQPSKDFTVFSSTPSTLPAPGASQIDSSITNSTQASNLGISIAPPTPLPSFGISSPTPMTIGIANIRPSPFLPSSMAGSQLQAKIDPNGACCTPSPATSSHHSRSTTPGLSTSQPEVQNIQPLPHFGASVPPPPLAGTFVPQIPQGTFAPPPPLTATGVFAPSLHPGNMPLPYQPGNFQPLHSGNFPVQPLPGSLPPQMLYEQDTARHQSPATAWSPPVFGENPEYKETSVLPASFETMASAGLSPVTRYRPIIPHWFYAVPGKPLEWKPFSFTDSINLEEAHRNGGCGLVSTDGGRFDVEVSSRVRRPVYWGAAGDEDHTTAVRRCSWFRKSNSDVTPVPYEEEAADKLEEAFRACMESGEWGRQVEVDGEHPGLVVLSSPYSMQHYGTSLSSSLPVSVSIAESQAPDAVKRGADDFSPADGECEQVDHLVFLVHGIGSVCDLSFRSVEQCVDTFREQGVELLQTHFHDSVEAGRVGRVEVLPVSWHKALHSDTDGIDQRLKPITLRSIPMLREFTNDTIVDVLLYTSPAYCQLIIDTVAGEINRMYQLFRDRNPKFCGGTSVAGHSLGSVILFDLLMHQKGDQQLQEDQDLQDLPADGGVELLQKKGVGRVLTASDIRAKRAQSAEQDSRRSVHYELGPAGTGQPSIAYPQLLFSPQAAFLLGSPIAMFLTVRGLTQLSPQYSLPTCPHVFNIFHPYDPVAYRLETLIHPDLTSLRPVLVPHHKGRKRMHLELKDTLERVGSDLKHKIVDSLAATWNKLYTLYSGSSTEQHMEQAEQEQLGRLGMDEGEEQPVMVGQLNAGRRIDYVLQEKPYESFTEYIFALQAHLSYWKSEDTLLLMLKEIYGSMGINCDAKDSQAAPPSVSAPPAFIPSAPTSPTFTPAAPAAPIPLFSSVGSSSRAAVLPPTVTGPQASSSGAPRVLGGRPVVDGSVVPEKPGVDPTAEPQLTNVPPPPTGTKLQFTRIKGGPRR